MVFSVFSTYLIKYFTYIEGASAAPLPYVFTYAAAETLHLLIAAAAVFRNVEPAGLAGLDPPTSTLKSNT